MLDPSAGVLIQGVDSQAVLIGVDDRQQLFAEENPLAGADQALEDGILNALTEVFTSLRHLAEATASRRGCRADVVGDQVKHNWRSIRLAEDARGIAVRVASEVTEPTEVGEIKSAYTGNGGKLTYKQIEDDPRWNLRKANGNTAYRIVNRPVVR